MVFLLWRIDLPVAFFKKLFGILRPLIIGGAIAFILNKPVMKVQTLYKKLFNRKSSVNKRGKEKTFYALSIVTVYILTLALIVGIIRFIIPQISESIVFFTGSFKTTYYPNFNRFIENISGNLNAEWLDNLKITEKLYSWISNLSKDIPDIIKTTFGITKNIINTFFDIFVGLIFSVYVLADKKKLKNQTGKLFRSILSENNYKKTVAFYNLFSNTFSHFINGQLTDACILGILCFIGMTIGKFQYSVLISVIIAITNLIPIFGPLLGTIPCAFILLLVDPISAVWFIVFIIVLQQIDSNLIYPRVVGGSVGLAPFWTMLSIIIGGGMFGILGMILAVPIMSILYVTISELVNKTLAKKSGVTSEEKNK